MKILRCFLGVTLLVLSLAPAAIWGAEAQDAAAYTTQGSALDDQGKLDEAVAAYRKAIEIYPRYVVAYNNLGAALYEKEEDAQAITALQRFIKLAGDDPKLQDSVADVREMLQDMGVK